MTNTHQGGMANLEAEAVAIRDRARSVTAILAACGHRRARALALLKSINVVVGVALLSMTFIPMLRDLVGAAGTNVASAVASAVLLADVVVPLLITGPAPEIFLTFAFYTDSYATQIDQILLEPISTERDRHYRSGRLQELLRHARLNFDDVRVRFLTRLLAPTTVAKAL